MSRSSRLSAGVVVVGVVGAPPQENQQVVVVVNTPLSRLSLSCPERATPLSSHQPECQMGMEPATPRSPVLLPRLRQMVVVSELLTALVLLPVRLGQATPWSTTAVTQ